MTRLPKFIIMLAIVLVFNVAASADTPHYVFLGNSDNASRYAFGLDPASGGANSAFPDFAAGGVYQQVYAGGAFPGPVMISQIAFADNAQLTSGPGTATYEVTISLSTTAATANGLSTNMTANRGANFVQVFTGQVVANITDNDHFDLVVDITPFAFDPGAGNLLMEVVFNSPTQFTGGSNLYFQAGSNPLSSRAVNPKGVAGGAFTDSFGLRTRLTATIIKPIKQVVLSNLDQTYDGSPKTVTVTTEVPVADVVVTYDGSTTAPTNAGSYAVTATINDLVWAGQATGTLNISKASQQIAFAPLGNKLITDPDFGISAVASSNLPVVFSAVGNCSVAGAQVHLTAAGLCTITASQSGTANINAAAPLSRTFSINKLDQQITFDPIPDKKFGDADITVHPTASSNLAVSIGLSGNCVFGVGFIHFTGAGSCTITAREDGSPTYNAATPVARTFAIAKADQQITFSALNDKKFGDVDFNVSATASSNLGVAFSASGNCSVAGDQVHLTGAGACTVTVAQDGDANFNGAGPVARTFSIGKADQQITFNSLANRKFGDADFLVSATSSSNLAVALSTGGNCAVSGTQVHLTGAGSCTITASQSGDPNTNAAVPVPRTFLIGKADQQITFAALTDKKFGDADFGVNSTASSSLAVALSASGDCSLAGSQVHLTGAGACTITASQNGDANNNAAAPVSRTFAIGKADQEITFAALTDRKFGDADFIVSAAASSHLGVAFSANGNCTVTGMQVRITGAGPCTINASQEGNANINAAPPVSRAFSISKADQQISFDALADRTLGDPDFNVSATASSNLAVVFSATGNCAVTNAQVHLAAAGACTITASQEGSSDYNPAPAVSRTFGITDQPASQTLISFGASAYEVTERVGVVQITVKRTGDTSRGSTVDYATDDTGASLDCSSSNGLAAARCDFNAAFGTLDFAPGEVEKTIDVVINRDSRLEVPFERFTVKLSDPTGGATLSTPANTTIQIDDASGGVPPNTNVIDDTRTFVRQQYHDFLNREPDIEGLNFWVDNIDQCDDPARRPANQTVARCKDIMRVNTSAAFFLSIEFLQSGGLVHSFYAAALDRPNGIPGYTEFIRDSQAVGRSVIVGKAGWQHTLNYNRDVFMKDFVMRPEFVGLYPTNDTPAQFVDKLYLHAGITTGAAERADAIAEFGSAADASDPGARGRALLRITQNAAFQAREINRNFVQMQYAGYLRRSPNDAPDANFDGYDFWLKKLDSFNGNYIDADMVKAFLDSQEYRARFGP